MCTYKTRQRKKEWGERESQKQSKGESKEEEIGGNGPMSKNVMVSNVQARHSEQAVGYPLFSSADPTRFDGSSSSSVCWRCTQRERGSVELPVQPQ